MSQDEILNTWGDPDTKENAGQDELGIPKERWIYKTHPPLEILSGHSYVCTTFILTFTGKNLTDYKAAGGNK